MQRDLNDNPNNYNGGTFFIVFEEMSMRDNFYDFADDYEPVKAFFNGEQVQIFTRALDMLAIYDDSKTYIVDEELEKIVAEMRQITGQNKPYKNIPKLPELRTKFMTAYSAILEREEKPVIDAIDKAKARVIEVLNTKEYAEEKREKYSELFREIHDGAEKCNNVSALRSFADKADALKIRLMNEMDARDRQIAYAKQLAAQKAAEEAERGRRWWRRWGSRCSVLCRSSRPPAALRWFRTWRSTGSW